MFECTKIIKELAGKPFIQIPDQEEYKNLVNLTPKKCLVELVPLTIGLYVSINYIKDSISSLFNSTNYIQQEFHGNLRGSSNTTIFNEVSILDREDPLLGATNSQQDILEV